MPSKELKAKIDIARNEPNSHALDLKDMLGENHEQYYADLVWLDQELWTLPHVREIDLSTNHKIDSKSHGRILMMVRSHPNILKMITGSASIVDCNSLNRELKNNFSDFSYAPGAVISSRDRRIFFDTMQNYLRRKAIHAIIGNRPDEIKLIFEEEIAFQERLTRMIAENDASEIKMREIDAAVQADYDYILTMNHSPLALPLPCYREGDKVDQDWMYSPEVKELQGKWSAHATSRLQTAQSRNQYYTQYEFALTDCFSARVDAVTHYIRTYTSSSVADFFGIQVESFFHNPASLSVKNSLEKILTISANENFATTYNGQCFAARPISLAFEMNRLESFKALLYCGTNPFISKEFFKKILDSEDHGQAYLLSMIDYFKEKTHTNEQKEKHKKEKIEFGAVDSKILDYSCEESDALSNIYSAILDYFTGNFEKRISAHSRKWLVSSIPGREIIRHFTGTTTRDRGLEIIEFMLMVQDSLTKDRDQVGDVLTSMRARVAKGRSSIFFKRKEGHYLQQLGDYIESLSNLMVKEDNLKELADNAKDSLAAEVNQRKAAIERQNAEIAGMQGQLQESNDQAEKQRSEARLQEVRGHYSTLLCCESLQSAEKGGDEAADSYILSMRFMLEILKSGSEQEKKKFESLKNFPKKLLEAQRYFGLVEEDPLTRGLGDEESGSEMESDGASSSTSFTASSVNAPRSQFGVFTDPNPRLNSEESCSNTDNVSMRNS